MKVHASLLATSLARTTSKVTRRAAALLLSVGVLLAGGVTAVRGQSALDGFDPNANGAIYVVVVQPDGKILIGGAFTALSPNGGAAVTRNHIARLNPDGTLDAAFDPNANNVVLTIAVQADGKILVGGDFSGANSIGGQTRNRIARLDATTGLADSFDPNANNRIHSIVVQANGKILVGGDFSGTDSIGGQTRDYMARLDATTGLADSFDANASFVVVSIAVQPDGKILVGGGFDNIGGQPRNYIARLNPTTGLADSFDPNADNSVDAFAVQADGKILVSGGFTTIGGESRYRIARLDAATGLADSFDPDPSGGSFGSVDTIAVQADGKILAGGEFTSIGGALRNHIARLDPMTGLADSFDPNASSDVYTIAVQADGKVLAGGYFTSFSPNGGGAVTRNNIARLETDGRLDRTLDLGGDASDVSAIAVQPDGKILIGGAFSTILGVPRGGIARLNTDGTLDMAFDPNTNGRVYAIAVQADGNILASGYFTSVSGQERNYIARLDATTGLADSFNPDADDSVWIIAVQMDGRVVVGGYFHNINAQTRNYIARLDTTGSADSFDPNPTDDPFSIVYAIAVQADGRILAGGGFQDIGGQPRNHIARLDPATGLADSFDPNASGVVYSIAVQSDGKILAGGGFQSIGGQTRNRIARLDAATGLADSLNPNANDVVYSVAVQADGKILAGGWFTNIGGQTRHYIARLDGTTGLADSFNPGVGVDNLVDSLAVQADGKILAGGAFTTISGQSRIRFARLTNDTAALQDLAVTRSAITWTRSGCGPQFTRVTFEYSTDNVNYTPLGKPTAAGSSWTLTGLNLTTGQNIYIRARGYYRGGYQNGSESISESVRNAFITLPPTPSQVVSRKLHNGTPRDIILPLSGRSGIECRSGGGTNDYQVVFAFPSSVTFTNATVSAGAGSVSGSSGSGTTTSTVNLTGITNAQWVTVTLQGVSDGTNTGDLVVQMGVLVGDTNGNGAVNASDVSQTKGQLGQAVTSSNFRNDVNVSGTISASDVSLVKSQIGTSIFTAAEDTKLVRDSDRALKPTR
jgi:uncharacterized delta-60 repeat protein